MAAHIATSLDKILLGVQAQLMSALSFPAERVLLVDLESLDFHPHGDQYVIVWPDTEAAVIPDVSGSGRINCEMTERFFVYLRTRFAVDESSSALKWLTDASLGHLVARHKIYNALIDFQVTDSNNNILNFPIWPVSGARAARGYRSRPVAAQARTAQGTFAPGKSAPPDKAWGESVSAFDVRYQLNLDTSVFL